MFRKLISNLPFSPSLANQVSFYVKRLKQEEFVRRTGLVFVTLAMVVQSFVTISPPQPALAVGPNNIVYSGVTSINDLLDKYQRGTDDNGHNDIKQIFDYYKINEDSIRGAKITTIKSTDRGGDLRSIGRYKQGFSGETAVQIPGTSSTVYERYLADWDSGAYSTYSVIEGTRTDGTYFAVLMSCGNIVIDEDDEPERPPTANLAVTCDAITGTTSDKDGDIVPVRAWIRVVNESKTTGGWIDITGKIPYTITEEYHSYENNTRVSVEIQDIDTGIWSRVISGQEFGPCLEPPKEPEPGPDPVIACSSLTLLDIFNRTQANLRTVSQVENATVQAYRYVATDAQGNEVTTKTVNSSSVNNDVVLELEEAGTYSVTVTVVTSEGEKTSPACNLDVTIEPPEVVIACKSLNWIDTLNRTQIKLRTVAGAENAVIEAYRYVVTDTQEKEVTTKTVPSSSETNEVIIDLEDPGDYQVEVTVVTSEGERTSPLCNEQVTVSPPEVCLVNPDLPKDHEDCRPCIYEGYEHLWFDDPRCEEPVFETNLNKTAGNITQGIEDANNTNAKPEDIIEYKLFTKNTGNVAGEIEIEENLADVLEYAKLIESDGAEFFEETGLLSWGVVSLQPEETVVKTIRIQVNSTVAATAQSDGDRASYDLILRNVYGDDVINIKVPCSSTGRCVEQVVKSLPNTGPGINAAINVGLVMLSVYFFMRTRQMGRELSMVKREYNYGV